MVLKIFICWWGLFFVIGSLVADPRFFADPYFMLEQKTEFYFEGGPTNLQELLYGPQNRQLIPNTTPLRTQIWENILAWMQECERRGINVLNLPILSREGVTLCDFKTLRLAKFKLIQEVGDLFPLLAMESKRRNIILSISLDELGNIVNDVEPCAPWLLKEFWTPAHFASLVEELGEATRIYEIPLWLDEQNLDETYRQAIALTARKYKIKYICYSGDKEGWADIFCSEEYATFPIDIKNQKTRDYLYQISQTGIVHGRLGYQTMTYGLANTFQKKTGMICVTGWGFNPGIQNNIALYRAVQFCPVLYGFYHAENPASENQSGAENPASENQIEAENYLNKFQFIEIVPQLKKFQRQKRDSAKPMANLIINIPTQLNANEKTNAQEAMTSSLETATNTITSAGYELYVTLNYHIPGAKLYYILTAGELPETFLSLFSTQEPIFLQNCWGYPQGTTWERIAPLFGLPIHAEILTTSPNNPYVSHIPEECQYMYTTGLATIPYQGIQFNFEQSQDAGRLCSLHQLIDIPFQNLPNTFQNSTGQSQNLPNTFQNSTGQSQNLPNTFQNSTGQSQNFSGEQVILASNNIALITRQKNYFFINGNFLHLSVSNILTNLISSSPIFLDHSYIYLTTGSQRSAIFSAEDTPIHLALPQHKQGEIYHWNAQGKLSPTPTVAWQKDCLIGSLKKWELVIILTKTP